MDTSPTLSRVDMAREVSVQLLGALDRWRALIAERNRLVNEFRATGVRGDRVMFKDLLATIARTEDEITVLQDLAGALRPDGAQ